METKAADGFVMLDDLDLAEDHLQPILPAASESEVKEEKSEEEKDNPTTTTTTSSSTSMEEEGDEEEEEDEEEGHHSDHEEVREEDLKDLEEMVASLRGVRRAPQKDSQTNTTITMKEATRLNINNCYLPPVWVMVAGVLWMMMMSTLLNVVGEMRSMKSEMALMRADMMQMQHNLQQCPASPMMDLSTITDKLTKLEGAQVRSHNHIRAWEGGLMCYLNRLHHMGEHTLHQVNKVVEEVVMEEEEDELSDDEDCDELWDDEDWDVEEVFLPVY